MRAVTAATVALAVASGLHGEQRPAQGLIDGTAPLSFTAPDALADTTPHGDPSPLGQADWPAMGSPRNGTFFNNTRYGMEISDPVHKIYLAGPPPSANCVPDVVGEYGNSVIGFVKANCYDEETGAYVDGIYNTYTFSQEPNRTYLEHAPIETAAQACREVRAWDPINQKEAPYRGAEIVQPLHMGSFLYEELCFVADAAEPDKPVAPAEPADPRRPAEPVQTSQTSDPTTAWVTTSLAAFATGAGIAGCLYRRRHLLHRVHPQENAVELTNPPVARA